MLETLKAIDLWIFLAVNRGTHNDVFDWIMPVMSDTRTIVVPGVLFLLWAVFRGTARTRWAILMILIVFSAGDSLNAHVLKPFFNRPRPYEIQKNAYVYKGEWKLSQRINDKNTLAFPSNHAVNMAALASVLAYFYRKLRWIWIALAATVCFSRVYLGLHWPADVAAGAMFGMGLAGIFIFLQSVLAKAFPNRFHWLAEEVSS